jgi:HEAT repeat protein
LIQLSWLRRAVEERCWRHHLSDRVVVAVCRSFELAPAAVTSQSSVGDGGAYGRAVNSADLQGLRSGDLETREAHVYDLLDRARTHGAESAIAALHALVRDYRDFHRSGYSRAMNQAAVFADAGLQEPLLAALGDAGYNCQAWATMGCAAMDIRAAVPQLITLLNHPQWMVRDEAVTALGRLGDASVVPALRPLLGDQADWLRRRTADALARIGGDAALQALWHEFEHRRFPRIGYIASTLASFTPEVVPQLLAAADSTDPDQRYWAAVALGSTGDNRAALTLERLMADDHGVTVFDGEVRTAAKKALRTLRRIQAAIAERESAKAQTEAC